MLFAGLPFAELAAIFAVAGAAVVALYILKLRRRTVAIPFSPLWQRPTIDSAERDPRAITEAHRRRLDGGRLLATAPRLDWAALLERTYEVDVFRCPRCHGAARVVAAITEPAVIRKILDHVREPPARAPPSGARRLGEDGVDAADVWLDPEVDVGA